ncbi:Nedd8-activating enzyme E1 regulatory subunit [Toxocara canis]|uniref:Nedd8-activating enzyme E1 regulatory subunit n=1 Tax=Toxocara canis TaxID=6265 RepID=A0A0B2VYA1_TOXCA|nr:Nedd8-activating enzyme E1 regulatory subunit [Toxocara canis]
MQALSPHLMKEIKTVKREYYRRMAFRKSFMRPYTPEVEGIRPRTVKGAMTTTRYDRQLRLWGDEGQASIERASVCMLGSSALATEILKSLVLAGIKSVHIVDSALVTNPDVGNNFFVEQYEVGQPRAKVSLRWLKELNSSVRGEYDLRSVEQLVEDDLEFLHKFTAVIGANLHEKDALLISDFLFERNIPFVHARVFGFVGYVRICVKEHTIIDTHTENLPPDVRLDRPFQELREMVDAIDLDSMTYEEHSHTPYLLLYLKALELWRKELNDESCFPDDYKKRKHFETVFMSLRRPQPDTDSLDEENFVEGRTALARSMRITTVPSDVRELLEHRKAKEPDGTRFWLLIAALRRFLIAEGVMPLTGELPDMVSDSQRYVSLASIYRKHARDDAQKVFQHAKEILKERGLPSDLIKLSDCEFFCRNSSKVRVQHGTTIAQEIKSQLEDVLADVRNADLTPNPATGVAVIPPAIWYVLLRAVDRFYSEKSRYPGTNGVPCTIDSHDLKARVVGLVADCELMDGSAVLEKIPEGAIDEMCRYGCAELHVIASLVGGIAAQELGEITVGQGNKGEVTVEQGNKGETTVGQGNKGEITIGQGDAVSDSREKGSKVDSFVGRVKERHAQRSFFYSWFVVGPSSRRSISRMSYDPKVQLLRFCNYHLVL